MSLKHLLLRLGGRGMHLCVQTHLQLLLTLSKLVLKRTNSLQGLELMRQSLLRLLHLLFRLLCTLRLLSHLHVQQAGHVAGAAPEQPVRRSTRPHNAPGEWWKANYRRAQSTPSVEPTPEPPEPPEPEENDVEQNDDEQEIKQESSDEDEEESAALTHAGQRRPPPRTLKEALKRPDHAKWKEAADLEIQAHITNGTGSLVSFQLADAPFRANGCSMRSSRQMAPLNVRSAAL